MTVLYILVPIALVLVIAAIWVFNWAVNNGQYDDLDGPAHSILFDDEDPAHLAAQQARSKNENDNENDKAQTADTSDADPSDGDKQP